MENINGMKWTLSQPYVLHRLVHEKLIHMRAHTSATKSGVSTQCTHFFFVERKFNDILSCLRCIAVSKIRSYQSLVPFIIRSLQSLIFFHRAKRAKLNCQKNNQRFNHFVIQIKYRICILVCFGF